jgi:hypothetical protein
MGARMEDKGKKAEKQIAKRIKTDPTERPLTIRNLVSYEILLEASYF